MCFGFERRFYWSAIGSEMVKNEWSKFCAFHKININRFSDVWFKIVSISCNIHDPNKNLCVLAGGTWAHPFLLLCMAMFAAVTSFRTWIIFILKMSQMYCHCMICWVNQYYFVPTFVFMNLFQANKFINSLIWIVIMKPSIDHDSAIWADSAPCWNVCILCMCIVQLCMYGYGYGYSVRRCAHSQYYTHWCTRSKNPGG